MTEKRETIQTTDRTRARPRDRVGFDYRKNPVRVLVRPRPLPLPLALALTFSVFSVLGYPSALALPAPSTFTSSNAFAEFSSVLLIY